MRIYLILMIALALVASYGCSSKNSAGRTPDETAKLARSGGNSSASENNNSSISNPGMEAERKRREAERNGTSEGETSENDSNDSEDAGEEDAGEEEAGEEDKGEEAENKPEKPASTRSAARRRRRVQTPQMGGGNMEEERKRREAEKAAKGQASNQGNPSGLGSRRRPTGEVEADEKTEEKFVSFYDRAVKAFAKDYDPEGFQFLYAHYLTDENAFIDHPLGWYEGVSEPRVALRWGVAIDYNDGGFEGEPPVIGDPVADDSGSRDNNRGRGNRRGGDSDFGAPSGSGGRNVGTTRFDGHAHGRHLHRRWRRRWRRRRYLTERCLGPNGMSDR